MKAMRIVAIGAALVAATAIIVAVGHHNQSPTAPPPAKAVDPVTLPVTPESYIGVYRDGVPGSYAGLTAFTQTTGIRPGVVPYFSGWFEPFQVDFAKTAAAHGAVPLVQIEPSDVSLTAIAAGQYDTYLSTFATAVRSYRYPVIVSFGHEMNGWWYSWGYGHTSPTAFVAAWRHIVTVFRGQGAWNVTWLWTVNVIDKRCRCIPPPAPWWPGDSYVTWVGIDGHYYKPSWRFAPLFGPTIRAVRALTRHPILVAETGAAPGAGKPAKIADLFAGIRAYGLLGFVWFDADGTRDWRIDSPAAVAAFRLGAKTFRKPGS